MSRLAGLNKCRIGNNPAGSGNMVAGDLLLGKTGANENGDVVGTMPNNGAVTITPNNTTQVIAQGYHNGSGSVPAVTFDTSKVLTGTTIANSAGTMPNNGGQSATLDTTTTSKTIPAGYTSGGTVSISTQEKSVTPTTNAQDVTPDAGRVLSRVTVAGVLAAQAFAAGEVKATDIQVSIVTSNSTSAIKIGSGIQINNASGTIRLKYSLVGNDAAAAYAAIYKNGVQVGTLRTMTTSTWTDFSEDFSYNYGDTFEMRAWEGTSGYQISMKNFALYVSAIPVYYAIV